MRNKYISELRRLVDYGNIELVRNRRDETTEYLNKRKHQKCINQAIASYPKAQSFFGLSGEILTVVVHLFFSTNP